MKLPVSERLALLVLGFLVVGIGLMAVQAPWLAGLVSAIIGLILAVCLIVRLEDE